MMQMKLSSIFISILSGVFLVAGVILIVLVNFSMRQQALEEAQSKARIILDRNLATHTYFTHQLKPSVFVKGREGQVVFGNHVMPSPDHAQDC